MDEPRAMPAAPASSLPTCYICVLPGADDRDHLIPAAFFPPPRPANLVTLPAHHACHNRLSEDYARAILAGFSQSPTATLLRRGAIRRSLVRSDLGGMHLRRDLIRTLVPRIELRSPSGLLVDAGPGIRFDRGRVYPLLTKIVRGLYYHHTGRFLATDARFYWGLNEEPLDVLATVFARSVWGLTHAGVFECRYSVHADTAGETTVWWLRFYAGAIFRCAANTEIPADATVP